jgi:hypothetical protein
MPSKSLHRLGIRPGALALVVGLGLRSRRIHGTHACRPVELFETEEKPALMPAPTGRYDLPIYVTAKVHRDHHIEVARALCSIPGNLIGARVDVRADSELVRVYHRATLIKIHPRQAPGGRVTDPDDLAAEKTAFDCPTLDSVFLAFPIKFRGSIVQHVGRILRPIPGKT